MTSYKYIFALASLLPGLIQGAIPREIDSAFAHFTTLPNTLVPILESVTDQESADAAAPQLNAVLPQVYDARTELTAINSLPPQVRREVLQKYEQAMRENWGKLYEQLFRLQQVRCYNSLAFFRQFHALCAMLNK